MKKLAIDPDTCPKCGGELDTGYECNDCDYDALAVRPWVRRETVVLIAKLLALAAVCLLACLLASYAHGESCATTYGVRARTRAVVVENSHQIIYPPTVAVVAQPLAVVVPQYSAQYAGLPPEVLLLLQQMGARLDSIDRQLAAPQIDQPVTSAVLTPSAPAMPTMPAAADATRNVAPATPNVASQGTPRAYTHCASCHSGAAAKGGNHVLFANGQPLAWDCGQIGEIMDRITRAPNDKGAMPPDGSDEDVAEIITDCKLRLRQAAKR